MTPWSSAPRARARRRLDWDGVANPSRLFQAPRWETALTNLFVFGTLFILISLALGLLLAILLDQQIRAEGAIRTIYLYPMAISFIVTGTAWKWILNPGLGLEAMVRGWGWEGFTFDWMINPDRVIAQFEGAATFGAGVALTSALSAEGGRIREGNFHTGFLNDFDLTP